MRKVGLYLRVSTEEQARVHEGSLVSQRRRLEDHVNAKNMLSPGWGQVRAVYVDEAKSGKDTNRPEFRKMLGDVEKGIIDTILVTELSRLSRSVKDFCNFWDFLRKYNAQFLSLREQFDTSTAAGEMMIFSILNFAQFERKQTSERVSANFQSRAMRGLYNGGYAPLGFEVDPQKKGVLVINEAEAPQVRRIFEIFLKKGSLFQTIDQLKIEGIRTKSRTTKSGKCTGGREEWALSTLWSTLKNRHFIGEREINKKNKDKGSDVPTGKEYKVTKAVWPAIVDKKIFEAVQKLLLENRDFYSPEGRSDFNYFLSSLVHCSECGAAMVGMSGHGKQGTKYKYYGHKKTGVSCTHPRIEAEELHSALVGRFKTLARSPVLVDRIYQQLEKRWTDFAPDLNRRISSLRSEIDSLASQSKNLLDRIQNLPPDYDATPLLGRLQEIEAKQRALQESESALISTAKASPAKADGVESIRVFIRNWNHHFKHLTASEQRQFAKTCLSRVEIAPNRVIVKYNNYVKSFVNSAGPLGSADNKNAKTGERFFESRSGGIRNLALGSYGFQNGSGGGI